MRRHHHDEQQRDHTTDHNLHRQILIGSRRWPAAAVRSAQIGEAALQPVPDDRQRANETDDAAGRNRARADVKNVGAANVARAHFTDRHRAGCDDVRRVFAKKFDRWNQNEIREHTARTHDRCNARPNDVTDAEQRRINFHAHRSGFEWRTKNLFRNFFPSKERSVDHVINESDAETGEDRLTASGRLFIIALVWIC